MSLLSLKDLWSLEAQEANRKKENQFEFSFKNDMYVSKWNGDTWTKPIKK